MELQMVHSVEKSLTEIFLMRMNSMGGKVYFTRDKKAWETHPALTRLSHPLVSSLSHHFSYWLSQLSLVYLFRFSPHRLVFRSNDQQKWVEKRGSKIKTRVNTTEKGKMNHWHPSGKNSYKSAFSSFSARAQSRDWECQHTERALFSTIDILLKYLPIVVENCYNKFNMALFSLFLSRSSWGSTCCQLLWIAIQEFLTFDISKGIIRAVRTLI